MSSPTIINTDVEEDEDVRTASETAKGITIPSKVVDEDLFSIDEVDIDDVYPDQAKDMLLEINSKKKSLEFKINPSVVGPYLIPTKTTDFAVTDSPSACWAFEKNVKAELQKIQKFDALLVTLHYPEEIKGMDNRQTYKNYIKYVKNSTERIREWGEIIQSNIDLIKTLCSDAAKNVSWLDEEEGLFGNNSSERSAMHSIRKLGFAAIKALDLDIKTINSQLSTVKIVTESSSGKRDLLVRQYLKDQSDLKIERQRLKYTGEAAARQAAFDKKTAQLIKDNKAESAEQRANFLSIIKKNAEEHQKTIDDLNDKNQLKIDKMIKKASDDLEAQALKFQGVLDSVNKRNREAIKELHAFYEDKIAKITEAFQNTIDDLKQVIKDYEKKLDDANKLIAKYYSALDSSQKSQADMLLEFKNISKDRVSSIETVLHKEKKTADDIPKPITQANAVLTGGLGLNAALGAATAEEKKIQEAKDTLLKEEIAKEKTALLEKKEKDKQYLLAGSVLGLFTLAGLAYVSKSSPGSSDSNYESDSVKKKKKKKKK